MSGEGRSLLVLMGGVACCVDRPSWSEGRGVVFVVAPVTRRHIDGDQFAAEYPVVFETTRGYALEAVAARPSRDSAQKLADALNAALAT